MTISGFFRTPVAGGLGRFAVLAIIPCSLLAAAQISSVADPDVSPAVAITIDSENLIELYQSVPDIRIVDSRLRGDYAMGHIELSHNLPVSETNCQSLSRLAEDRDTAMVFYCNGGKGKASTEALQIASSCGYRRLFWLRGGFIEWQDKDYPFVIE